MNNNRENLVYLAKLAEQAERFDEMAKSAYGGSRSWGGGGGARLDRVN